MREDQATTRSCYVTSLGRNATSKTLNVEEVDPRKEKEGVSLAEELTNMISDPERLDWFVYVGSLQDPEHHAKLTQFLRQNQGVFDLEATRTCPKLIPKLCPTSLMSTQIPAR